MNCKNITSVLKCYVQKNADGHKREVKGIKNDDQQKDG